MVREFTNAKGKVVIELIKATGEVERVECDNMVVATGKSHIAARLGNTPPTQMGYIAVGTGANAPASGDTSLQSEIYRKACTVSPTGNTVQYSVTLAPGEGTGGLTEAGIFNASSSGTMLSRVTFAVKNKASGDTMTITWTVTIN